MKHILDGFRGDVTTVLGAFASWTFPPMVLWQETWLQYRTAFIVMTLIFYNMLLQPIMQGQIVDAFAELRARYKDAKYELENKCFVTGLDKEAFNDYPGEWEARKEGEYALRYLLLLKHLLDKDPADYTGLENDVMDSVNIGEADFLPLGAFFAKRLRDRSVAASVAMGERSTHSAAAASSHSASEVQKELKELKERHADTQKTLEALVEMVRTRLAPSSAAGSAILGNGVNTPNRRRPDFHDGML